MSAKNILKALPAPKESPQEITAKQYFGIALRSGDSTYLKFSPAIIWNGEETTAVSVHTTEKFLDPFLYTFSKDGVEREEKFPGLYRVFGRLRDPSRGVVFLLPAINTNYAAFNRNTRNFRALVNPEYQRYLDIMARWVRPSSEKTRISRYLVYWGSSTDFIPQNEEQPVAALNANTLLPYTKAGPFIRETLLRLPPSGRTLQPDPITEIWSPLAYASPKTPIIRHPTNPPYIAIDNQVFAYVLGELTPGNIASILASDIDILTHIRLVDHFFYQTTILRIAAKRDENGRFNLAQLDKTTQDLNRLGRFDRLSGLDMKKAGDAYTIGNKPPPEDWSYSTIQEWKQVFTAMTSSIKPASDSEGTVFLGKTAGSSYLTNPQVNPSVLFSGTSKKAGKTATALAEALAYGPIILVPLTTTSKESYHRWGPQFHASREDLVLPDAPDILSETALKKGLTPDLNSKECRALQEKLMGKDSVNAIAAANRDLDNWIKYGPRAKAHPKILHPATQSVRAKNWVLQYLTQLYKEGGHERYYDLYEDHTIIVFDNFYELVKMVNSEDSLLGDTPRKVANNLAQLVGTLVNNGANKGLWTWILTQNANDLDIIRPNFYKSMALHVHMGLDEHYQHAELTSPNGDKAQNKFAPGQSQDEEVITNALIITLPQEVLDYTERSDDKSNSNGHVPEGESLSEYVEAES